MLQASFELSGLRGRRVVPPGLVATVPTLLTFLVVRVAGGPLGPLTFAQARLSCRSGARARALVAATAVDAPPAIAEALGAGWGIGGDAGPVALDRRYDRVRATVAAWGLALEVLDAAPIDGADIQYVVGLHPVTTRAGDDRLAQVELDVAVGRAERGRPVIRDYNGLVVDGAGPVPAGRPVVATLALGQLTLPRVRFLLDPDQTPPLGTEVLDQPGRAEPG